MKPQIHALSVITAKDAQISRYKGREWGSEKLSARQCWNEIPLRDLQFLALKPNQHPYLTSSKVKRTEGKQENLKKKKKASKKILWIGFLKGLSKKEIKTPLGKDRTVKEKKSIYLSDWQKSKKRALP